MPLETFFNVRVTVCMKNILASFVLVFLFHNSHARIGETFEQCTRRYGELSQDKADPNQFIAVSSGFGMLMTFRNNVCEAIGYQKMKKDDFDRPEKMTANEIEILVKNNFNGKSFTTKDQGDVILFDSNDRKIGATYKPAARFLIVMTTQEVNRINKEINSEEVENLKGL